MPTTIDGSLKALQTNTEVLASLTQLYTEMLWAANQTIGHRLAMMGRSGLNPNTAERREYWRMGSEKVDAAVQSSRGLWTNGGGTLDQWVLLNRYHVRLLTAIMATLTARSAMEWVDAQRRLGEITLRCGEMGFELTTISLNTWRQALGPYHSRVVANARRLEETTGK
ncbi:MAG: hypothetical protein ACFCBW_05310 [Candidatus Competibacterales bacterium]